jgi:hypothetical protein
MVQASTLSLDGRWRFWPDPERRLSPADLKTADALAISVPAPWQAQIEHLRHYTGPAWYRRPFDLPAEWLGDQELFLRFQAVNYLAEVWLNGAPVGRHEGGYLPFACNVTTAAQPGANDLAVRVSYPAELFAVSPHGKQSWYGPLSGIWQSVYLERRPAFHLAGLHLRPDLRSGCLDVHLPLATAAPEGCTIAVEILDPHEQRVAAVETAVAPGSHAAFLVAGVERPLAWSPDTPWLYRCRATLQAAGGALDSLSETFGWRTIETRDGRLLLNGEPIYLRGALDQDYYPGLINTAPSLAFLEDQLYKAKALGLNCLRCHIKAPDPRYYEVADRLGMLIWAELPNWTILNDRSARLAQETLAGILARDGNHPSIIAWTLVNEDWGTDLVHNAEHRAWLQGMVRWLKEQDPTRLVVDNSPCRPNFHVESDLEDYHHYSAIPDQRSDWDAFVNAFAGRPAWTFSPHGDAVRQGDEPLIVSEFGNWGLPDVDDLLDENGREPWWFETGHDWGEGVVYPHGVQERYHSRRLDAVFGSWRRFVEATQWQQYRALKYQIETMRLRPEIAGYVITEFTDVHWECNGLLDMARNPKVFHHELAAVNSGAVIIPRWQRTVYSGGERVSVSLYVAHGEGAPLPAGELCWRLAGADLAGRLAVPPLAAGAVHLAGEATFVVPEAHTGLVQQLEFAMRSEDGLLLATNHLDLTLLSRRPPVGSQL